MKLKIKAWLGLFGTVALASVWFGACGSGTSTDTGNGNAFCGDGRVEGTEQCDDGNQNNEDGCDNQCNKHECGDGVVGPGEECDDGNDIDDDDCSNSCVNSGGSGSGSTAAGGVNCGNGMLDDGEECDDGNKVNDDDCTNACTKPFCGDGIKQAGEDCDDGKNSENDMCPDDCKIPTNAVTTGSGPVDCDKQPVFYGVVTNPTDPTIAGSGVPAVWAYGGQIGTQAGDDMCAAIGADHACTYGELKKSLDKGELDEPANQTKLGVDNGSPTFWLHRTKETVSMNLSTGDLDPNGASTPPGPGGRCNDWTYPTGHIADGEFVTLSKSGSMTTAAYRFDKDTKYTGVQNDGHQGSGVADGGPCGNGSPTRGILCCYKECVPQSP